MSIESHDHHDHDHGHGHGHVHAPASFGAAFAVGVVLNGGLVLAQLGYGLAAHSVALLADAAHNFGDVLGLLLAWGAAWLGRRSPSARRTYGWGRSSILAALVNATVLLIGVGAIAVEAVQHLLAPAAVAGGTVMAVAALGIAINGVTAWLFSRGHDDLNIRAAFLHMAGDAAVSLGVLVSAGLILLTGWLWLDPLASLGIVAVITAGTWGVLRQATNLAMDGVPDGIAHAEVAAYLQTLPGVSEVHDLHIWGLSTTETALTAHLVREDGAGAEDLIISACQTLRQQFRIGHATLQLESATIAASCRLRPGDVV
jgi:cobalt-zinc-cadmium efflux system protein